MIRQTDRENRQAAADAWVARNSDGLTCLSYYCCFIVPFACLLGVAAAFLALYIGK